MIFTIAIDTDCPAFDDNKLGEVARILAAQAEKMSRFANEDTWSDILRDSHGYAVGRAELGRVGVAAMSRHVHSMGH